MSGDIETLAALQVENERLRQQVVRLEEVLAQQRHVAWNDAAAAAAIDQITLRQVFEHTADAAILIDQHGICDCNQAAAEMMGYTESGALIGQHPAEFSPEHQPDGRSSFDKANEMIATARRQGHTRFEWMHRSHSGKDVLVEVTLTALPSAGTLFIYGLWTDISWRKQAEQQLQMTRFALDHAAEGVQWVDARGSHVYANDAMCTMLGYTCAEFAALCVWDIDPNLSAASWLQIWERLKQSGAATFETTQRCKDGRILPVEISINFLDFNGNEYLCAFVRDISERKQAEHERAALQQQVIDAQREALRELSTPLIPLAGGVVLMPLIGSIDSQRAQQVMEDLLTGTAHYHASTVILDVTGVQVVDTQIASTFLQTARAVQLLGAQVILTGIQPRIAQTLVELGVDFGTIQTHHSLQAGIAAALRWRRR